MNLRKIIIITISAVCTFILFCIAILFFLYHFVTATWNYQEKTYYSDKDNFITEEAIVDSISYSEEYGNIWFVLSEIDEAYEDNQFVVRGENAIVLLERELFNKVNTGSKITYTSAPKYLGDGYSMPIVAITVDGEELLGFDEGYENLMESY